MTYNEYRLIMDYDPESGNTPPKGWYCEEEAKASQDEWRRWSDNKDTWEDAKKGTYPVDEPDYLEYPLELPVIKEVA